MSVRLAPVLMVATLLLASCTGGTRADRPAARPTPSQLPTASISEDAPSALESPANPAFPSPLIDLEHLVAGGPPPDGIPPIDQPNFRPAETVGWLEASEPVLALTVGGETRAYPLQVMTCTRSSTTPSAASRLQ